MTVTPLEHTAIGACAGSFEVCLMQPLMAIKNALQEGRPIPTQPRHLYRGLPVSVASMAPITASQFGTNRLVQQLMTGKEDGGDLSGLQKFMAAAAAGGTSGLIASPTELIIIQQQKCGRSLVGETRHFFSTYRPMSIFRGLTAAMGREGLYAAGYLGLFPIIREALDQQALMAPGANMMVAGLLGGFFGAFFSHPFDTAKTRMQAFMYSKPEYATLPKTMATIYREAGITTFWRGLVPRMTRIIFATFILNYVRTTTVDYLEKERAGHHA